jgi:type I restriction enzyme S subunit
VNEENELPNGWCLTTLGEICSKPQYGWTTKANPKSGHVRLLRTTDISSGLIDWNTVPFCTEVPENLPAYRLKEDDIVISRAGSVGVSYLLSYVPYETVFASYLIRFRPFESIEPRYMAYYLQTPKYWASIYEQSSGIALANVNARKLEAFDIPLTPRSEQLRIVSAIEQQFTRLDAGVAALRRAQAKLKRYRAAVLKAAVEGKLTEVWRAEHPTTEPASILLERILKERRARWEADLKAKGRDPTKVKYVEPAKPDTESLPGSPEGWCWATVEQVSQCIVDCLHSTPKFKESGFLCIDTNCIKPGRIVFEKVRYVDEDTFIERNRRMKPKENDVMFSREGALLGVSVRVPSNLEFCLGQRMMIFRLDQCIDASFYEKVLNSSVFRSQYLHEITGSASPHLNIQDIRRFMIPLPPFVEQQIVVEEVERRLSIVEKLESVTEANLKRAERLRQSILKEAFLGRLVPQVSNDEPASVLLERIRKEREGQKNGIVGNGRNEKVSSEPVKIDVEGTRQVELWEGVGGGG